MSFWTNFFSSPQENAEEGIYNDLSGVNNIGDVNKRFGLTQLTPGQISQSYNPARQNLATRQSQANAAAAGRMNGANATPQNTFGAINSQFAPAWGNLESGAAQEELQLPIQQQDFSANLFNDVENQKMNAASKLSDTSTFGDIFSGLTNIAKIPTGQFSNVLSSLFGGNKKSPADSNDFNAG
jgi:hypothetical protein